MQNSNSNNYPSAGAIFLTAIFVAAIGVVAFSIHTLWRLKRQPAAKTQLVQPEQTETTLAYTPAPDMPEPEVPATPQTSSADQIIVEQELQRKQIDSFRAIARENTNLSFQLSEEQIRLFEREERMVQ